MAKFFTYAQCRINNKASCKNEMRISFLQEALLFMRYTVF